MGCMCKGRFVDVWLWFDWALWLFRMCLIGSLLMLVVGNVLLWICAYGRFHKLRVDYKKPFGVYKEMSGLDSSVASDSLDRYGKNMFDIPAPKFKDLYIERALAPFFIFQIFSVGLWLLDDYWTYCALTLVLMFFFEATVVLKTIANLKELRKNIKKAPITLMVHRDNKWIKITSDDLVPGDLVYIRNEARDIRVPCDMVIVSGGCVVNEAMLTGESTPLRKESIKYREDDEVLNMKDDKMHILFSGTSIVQIEITSANTDHNG